MQREPGISLTELWEWIPEVQRISRVVSKGKDHEDLFGDVLVRMAEKRHLLREPGQIYTIVRNIYVSRFRRWGRHIPTDPNTILGEAPANQLERLHCREVTEAVDELPSHHREVILLAVAGHDPRKIAAILGVKDGTARSRLCRARQALERRLNE